MESPRIYRINHTINDDDRRAVMDYGSSARRLS